MGEEAPMVEGWGRRMGKRNKAPRGAGAADAARVPYLAERILESLAFDERREAQSELVRLLSRHIVSEFGRHDGIPSYPETAACFEAPTGTGKSFAVLSVAFALWAAARVPSVVATFTKVLQAQYGHVVPDFRRRLFESPLLDELEIDPELHPDAERAAHRDGGISIGKTVLSKWTWGIRKGKRNYVCLKRLHDFRAVMDASGTVRYRDGGLMFSSDAFAFRSLCERLSGISDLDGYDTSLLSDAELRHLNQIRGSSFVKCRNCKFASKCAYVIAAASNPALAIENHAILTGSMMDKEDLPEPEEYAPRPGAALFCDEGHHLMGFSTSGDRYFELSRSDIDAIAAFPFPSIAASRRRHHADARIPVLERYEMARSAYETFWTGADSPGGLLASHDLTRFLDPAWESELHRRWEGIKAFWDPAETLDALSLPDEPFGPKAPVFSSGGIPLGFVEEPKRPQAVPVPPNEDENMGRNPRYGALRDLVRRAASNAVRHYDAFLSALGRMRNVRTDETLDVMDTDDGWVLRSQGLSSFHDRLRRSAARKGGAGRAPFGVMAVLSGTLFDGSESGLAAFSAESGIVPTASSSKLGTTFPKDALSVWLPPFSERPTRRRDEGDPFSTAVVKFCLRHIPDYVESGRGGVLVLCTAKTRMKRVYDALGEELERRGGRIGLWMQGPRGNKRVARQFAASDGNGILVASDSFREGFDVPGRALTWAILDKLPFERVSEQLRRRLSLLTEAGAITPDGEYRHQIGLMEFAVRQSAGRVVRCMTDRGLFTILDPRCRPSKETIENGRFGTDPNVLFQAICRSLPDPAGWHWGEEPPAVPDLCENAKCG